MKPQPRMGLQIEVERVTPDVAQDWLARNTLNRRIRPRVVEGYARDMIAGHWRMSGEAIKFSKSGQLLDGQHRLQAVVASGATVPLLVVRGLEDAVQSVMDTGVARTAGDALRLRGDTGNYTRLAAAARLAIAFDAGDVSATNMRVTNTEVLDFIDRNPGLVQACELSSGSWTSAIDIPPSLLTYVVWRLLEVDSEACVQFFSKLSELVGLRDGDPILALHSRLRNAKKERLRVERGDYVSLVFRVWNKWARGEKVPSGKLPIRYNGGPVDIPEPIRPVWNF